MFPKQKDILDPLLGFVLTNGGPDHEVNTGNIYEPMAQIFGLTLAERNQSKIGGRGKQWEWMLQWARQALINRGLAEKCGHGTWRLTEAGITQAKAYKSISIDDVTSGLLQAESAVLFNQPHALFKKVDYDLAGLLKYIEMGDLGLPDLQRPFVWSTTKVRDLLDSMYRGFPIGHLLFWENSGTRGTKFIGVDGKQHTIPHLLTLKRK